MAERFHNEKKVQCVEFCRNVSTGFWEGAREKSTHGIDVVLSGDQLILIRIILGCAACEHRSEGRTRKKEFRETRDVDVLGARHFVFTASLRTCNK
jgi:hypothetical protein